MFFLPNEEEWEIVVDEPGNPGSYCMKCTVSEACFDYAIANKILYGVWGGTTAKERRKHLRALRQRKKAQKG